MSNLTSHIMRWREHSVAGTVRVIPDADGEFVKFDDAMELSKTVVQQLKSEIAYIASSIETCYHNNLFRLIPEYAVKLRQLSDI